MKKCYITAIMARALEQWTVWKVGVTSYLRVMQFVSLLLVHNNVIGKRVESV
jgi:hypothetical protein